MKYKDSLIIFVKGIFMGISDLIPGISGGTIALITGIYEKLIRSIKDVTHIPEQLFKKKFDKVLGLINFKFFIPLFLGVATAIILGSHAVGYLLDNYRSLVYGFFIGLIIASAHSIISQFTLKKSNLFFSFIGFLIGVSLSFIAFNLPEPSLIGISLLGFISISALILPGISGAYILLILGQYEFMIGIIRNIHNEIPSVISFGIGAVLGLALLSRVISYYYKKYRYDTLSLLVGLKIGALIVPLREITVTDTYTGFFMIFIVLLSYSIYKLVN